MEIQFKKLLNYKIKGLFGKIKKHLPDDLPADFKLEESEAFYYVPYLGVVRALIDGGGMIDLITGCGTTGSVTESIDLSMRLGILGFISARLDDITGRGSRFELERADWQSGLKEFELYYYEHYTLTSCTVELYGKPKPKDRKPKPKAGDTPGYIIEGFLGA